MSALRTLSLPISMAAFAALTVAATKVPEAVETVNDILWLFLLPVLLAKVTKITSK